jgi:RNA polymerase sigma-70 factor (ECF subfamily)
VPDLHYKTDEPWTRQHFVTTHWSLIFKARSEGPDAAMALDQLCRTYWPPLFVYARRDGLSPHDAQDAVQGFIAHLLARQDLNTVSPERGKFRSFLLAAFKHFLVSRLRGESAAKRGGDAVAVRLDADTLETICAPELADAGTPDKAFDRTWAHNLMARALQRLGAEHRTPRQARLFTALQPTLMDGGRVSREAELATQLGLTPGALAVAATRLRRRYRALIEDEVKQTLADPADLAEEMRALWLAWS